MRQGDGADLLGANDPRSASIGIIYVAPTDDRQSVLAAILTQDKLGRKQVAVVLPETNRAFQRPVDFDGLKNMRRGLKTEIVFVAPGGPGPAEFARQRRFTVFTSLESYASSLRAEAAENGGAKKGLFGRRQKADPANARLAPTTDVIDMRRPLPLPGAPAQPATPYSEDEDTKEDEKHISPLIGLAGAAGAAALGANLADNEDDLLPPPPSPSPPQGINTFSSANSSKTADETTRPTGSSGASRGAGPDIIAFGPRPRTTAKLPAAPAAPAAQSSTPSGTPPTKNGNTGKRSVVLAGAAGAGAGLGAGAAYGRTATGGGGQPPATGNTGGGGGGGGKPRRRSTRQLLAILLIILILLLLAGIAFASPAGQGVISHIIPGASTPTATVTITPKSKLVADNFVITAVTGTPDPKSRHVQARILKSPPSPAQSATAGATGSIAGTHATGTLLFINTGLSGVTISGGTLTGKDGVQVSFNGPLTIPIGSVTVLGTAVPVGVRGNIPALDIAGPCCGSSTILVRNPAPFSGGRDPIPNSVITQNDIQKATTMLISSLKPAAQAQLQSQVKKNEQVVPNSLNCTSNVTANHRVGDVAKSVTVTGTVTCTEEVYDQQAAFALVSSALMAEAAKDPGPGYVLVGTIVTRLAQAPVVDGKQTVSLIIHAAGVWPYQFTDTIKAQLAKAIANKPKDQALMYLQAVAGVSAVKIDISSGNILPDAAHITININPVPGVSVTPTTTPGSATPGSTPPNAPTSPPTTGLGGS